MSQLAAFVALQDGAQGGAGGLMLIFPYLLIFVVIYFLLIRPQQKERKRIEEEAREFRKALKNGDRVVTSGGIYGIVTSVREDTDTVQLRIADAVKIEVLRSSIASRQPEPSTEKS
jgi:preprotein translocase subunit YajC